MQNIIVVLKYLCFVEQIEVDNLPIKTLKIGLESTLAINDVY